MPNVPFILGIGGTVGRASSTQTALSLSLKSAEAQGAHVRLFGGEELEQLPHYSSTAVDRSPVARALVDAVRSADGVIIATPGYHGTISGLVKNAVDYLEETAGDARVYLDGVPVGLIVTAYGWQATGSTMVTLRSMVHALRGWPTPFGAAVRVTSGMFADGRCTDPSVADQMALVGQQVVDFARIDRVDPVPAHARNVA